MRAFANWRFLLTLVIFARKNVGAEVIGDFAELCEGGFDAFVAEPEDIEAGFIDGIVIQRERRYCLPTPSNLFPGMLSPCKTPTNQCPKPVRITRCLRAEQDPVVRRLTQYPAGKTSVAPVSLRDSHNIKVRP